MNFLAHRIIGIETANWIVGQADRRAATGGTEMLETARNRLKSRLRDWFVGSEDMPPYLLLSFLVIVYLTGVLIRISTAR